MKIDRKQLIGLICEKTGMKPESAGAQLDELTTRIREASNRGNALEIKGFGMFYHTESGDLTFEPAEELKTEVNHKYAGMDAVRVKKPAAAAAPFPLSGKPDKPSEEESLEHPLEKEEKNPAATLITSIVVVLVFVIGIILLVDFGYMDGLFSREQIPSPPQELSQTEVPAEPGPVITQTDEPDSDAAELPEEIPELEPAVPEPDPLPEPVPAEPDMEETADQPDQPETASAAPAVTEPAALFGLYGQIQMIDHRFYTIVVHSMQSESRAREAARELSEEGYRAIAITVFHDDIGQRWRVGIGQFETIPLAQNAASELPEEFRENHFIGLIQ